jgi:hypothetical protein
VRAVPQMLQTLQVCCSWQRLMPFGNRGDPGLPCTIADKLLSAFLLCISFTFVYQSYLFGMICAFTAQGCV